MGCRCAERKAALVKAASAVRAGDLRGAGQQAAFVGRTLAQDARSGALARAAASRLALMAAGRRR